MTNRRRIRDIRHDELIDATVSAVHRHGYSVVTMAEIAREAGASAASINYYFGSKDRLMEATMRRLLCLLKDATLDGLKTAQGPHQRLMALLDANFADRLFTPAQCSLWVQFWANAPYSPRLSRLQRINRQRVQNNFRYDLRQLLPDPAAETVREALQSYMDGVWLDSAMANRPSDPDLVRKEARRVAQMMLDAAG